MSFQDMDVSIIIVNYNTFGITNKCIESVIEKTKGVSYEIILVDNGSTDGSRDYFSNDKRIHYIYSENNLGFGKANNLGYSYSVGKYIFLLNSDTLLLNNAIKDFYDYMEKAPSCVGCVGCLLLDRNGHHTDSYGEFPQIKHMLGRVLIHYRIRLKTLIGRQNFNVTHPIDVDYITGADLFIRRSVIVSFGLFDPDFFLYYEETEMQYRYTRNGFHSQIINSPQIVHLGGGSDVKSKRRSLRTAIIELNSRFIYCKKVLGVTKMKFVAIFHLLLIPRVLTYNSTWDEKKLFVKTIFKYL